MSYKIIFSDIDGTLLTSEHTVLSSTVRAIKQLIAQNIIFVPVSARMPKAIAPVIAPMEAAVPLISYNGALILDENQKVLYSQYIELIHTQDIIKKIKTSWPDAVINFYSDDEWYVENLHNDLVQQEIRITGVKPRQKKFSELLARKTAAHKLLCMGSAVDCKQMEQQLSEQYPALMIIRSSDNLLEIVDASVSKAQAVQYFMADRKIDGKAAIAFGDNYNDMEMLKVVGTGIAMQNAPQPVKNNAKIVTDSNNEDGIYKALKKLQLIDFC